MESILETLLFVHISFSLAEAQCKHNSGNYCKVVDKKVVGDAEASKYFLGSPLCNYMAISNATVHKCIEHPKSPVPF